MRWVICFTAAFAGCVATIPAGDPKITADLAAETARMVILIRNEMPPAPAPSPKGDDCERCEGRGYNGDRASIRIACEACRGTGKKLKSVLVNPPCPDGKCRQ